MQLLLCGIFAYRSVPRGDALMLWDVLLVIGVGATQVVVTVYALVISIRKNQRRKAFFIGALGSLGLVLTVFQAIRSRRSEKELEAKIENAKSDLKKADDNLLRQITGGDGYFYIDASQDRRGSPWKFHVFNEDQVPLMNCSARGYLVDSLDGTYEQIMMRYEQSQQRLGTFKMYFGTLSPGGSSFDYVPVKSGSYLFYLTTRTGTFTEKLWLYSDGLEEREIYRAEDNSLLEKLCNKSCR